jgi:hypothetical protein
MASDNDSYDLKICAGFIFAATHWPADLTQILQRAV